MGPPITGMDRILREERELAYAQFADELKVAFSETASGAVECIFDVIDRVLDDLCEEA